MAMKVYGPVLSTNVARILVCLEEVGAEYEVVAVDLSAGEHKRPAHVARNPFGQVPAFQDGDLILFDNRSGRGFWRSALPEPVRAGVRDGDVEAATTENESRAISKYILRKGGSHLLRESNLSQSALVDVWLDVESHNFDIAMSAITFQCLTAPIFMGRPTNHEIVEENLAKLKKALEVYETRLSKYKYLAGDFISFADLSHSPMLHYLLATHASAIDAYPHVKAWIADILERPTVKKVTELMGIPYT